jgi:hypothetical protein
MAQAHCMLDTLVTNTHSEYAILITFPLQNSYTETPQSYVIRALPIWFIAFKTAFLHVMRVKISPLSINVLEYMNLLSLDQFITELTGCFMIHLNCQFI